MEKSKQANESASIADSLAEYVGKDVADLIKELHSMPDYSEFKLAEALGKELNATRNLLYKLHSLNLASFVKKKDNKIGWYIYYWTFHEEKINTFLLNEKKNKIEALRERAVNEIGSSFYSCINKCARLDFDRAFDFSFRCPECGELLGQDSGNINNAKLAKELKKLEREVGQLELAVEVEKTKKRASNEGDALKTTGKTGKGAKEGLPSPSA